jgi:hypothetical protein
MLVDGSVSSHGDNKELPWPKAETPSPTALYGAPASPTRWRGSSARAVEGNLAPNRGGGTLATVSFSTEHSGTAAGRIYIVNSEKTVIASKFSPYSHPHDKNVYTHQANAFPSNLL